MAAGDARGTADAPCAYQAAGSVPVRAMAQPRQRMRCQHSTQTDGLMLKQAAETVPAGGEVGGAPVMWLPHSTMDCSCFSASAAPHWGGSEPLIYAVCTQSPQHSACSHASSRCRMSCV